MSLTARPHQGVLATDPPPPLRLLERPPVRRARAPAPPATPSRAGALQRLVSRLVGWTGD